MSLYKKLFLACTLAATLGQVHAEPTPKVEPTPQQIAAASLFRRSNPFSSTFSDLLGIPQKHLTLKNFARNASHNLLTYIMDNNINKHYAQYPNASEKEKTAKPLLLGAKNMSINFSKTMWMYKLTPLGSEAPTGYFPPFIDLFFESANCWFHALPSSARAALVALKLTKVAHNIFARNKLTKKLCANGVIVSSRTTPIHMINQEYLMLHSPLGFVIRNPRLYFSVSSVLNYITAAMNKSKKTSSAMTAFDSKINFFMPYISAATTLMPFAPHFYILKSDFNALPIAEQHELFNYIQGDAHTTLRTLTVDLPLQLRKFLK